MADKNFRLEVISPDRVFYEGDVEMIEFSSTDGDLGILAGHVPLTTTLEPGILKIHEQGGVMKKAALHSGFVTILPKTVTILAEVVEWPEEIDINRANEARIRAERRIKSPAEEGGVDVLRAELALKRAIARINILK
ncbi:MAG: ATP synthase F1 subunit epsilon [Lachnospiraceae bacterium]|nr:ATP synthase F1 subunit epsilon [Lachnospiraceae bacterium]